MDPAHLGVSQPLHHPVDTGYADVPSGFLLNEPAIDLINSCLEIECSDSRTQDVNVGGYLVGHIVDSFVEGPPDSERRSALARCVHLTTDPGKGLFHSVSKRQRRLPTQCFSDQSVV